MVVDLVGLRQAADRLSRAALILPSPGCALRSCATGPPASPNNYAQHRGEEARRDTHRAPSPAIFSASSTNPSSSILLLLLHPPSCGRTRCAQGALGDPGFVVVTRRGEERREREDPKAQSSNNNKKKKPGLPPCAGATCMDAPWPRLSAGFSF